MEENVVWREVIAKKYGVMGDRYRGCGWRTSNITILFGCDRGEEL